MNKQQLKKTQCDSEKLELFLRGTLSSSETELLEVHLTECASCARQIQMAAEQGVSWHEAQSLLAADEYDSPQHVAAMSSLLSDDHDSMTKHQTAEVLSREIRGWLDPTEDPRSMGRFAGYEIVGIVGHGGMGIVLKGFEASLNRFIAIKILAPRLATNGSARKRFAREAQAAAAVRHDNVIAIHRVDEWHGLPFLVMPYAGGISLQKRIDSDGPLSIEQTLRVGVQIASGLAAAHAQGLIHRDIKPANILLEQGVERVTITDFGLARAADDASVTRTGVIAGTPQYMSPEQAEARQLDARSDLFSLGSVLYAMATGRPPFRGAGSFEVLKRIVNEPARSMREIEASVPEWFENIVKRLHSKSPADRPTSASEVAELLRECLAHVQQPTVTSLPGSLTALAKSDTGNRRSVKSKFIAAAAFAFSLIFAGVLIVLEFNKGTLTIECVEDDVAIRIMQGQEIVKQLSVNQSGRTVRIAAGTYDVVIDGKSDGMTVEGGRVSLRRGDTEIAKIVYSDGRVADSSTVSTGTGITEAVGTESDSDFARRRFDVVIDGKSDGMTVEGGRFGDKITVDIYGGRDVMAQMNTEGPNKNKHVRLVQDLNAIDGVIVNTHESGLGNEIFVVTVRDPSMIGEKAIQIGEKSVQRKTAINSALRNAGIEEVHWYEAPRSQKAKTASDRPSRIPGYVQKTSDSIVLGLYSSQQDPYRWRVASCVIRLPAGSTIHEVFHPDADTSPDGSPEYTPIPLSSVLFAARHETPLTFRAIKIPGHSGQTIFVEFQVATLGRTISAELKKHPGFEIDVTSEDITSVASGKRITKVLIWSPGGGQRIDVRVSPENDPVAGERPIIEDHATVIAVAHFSQKMPPKRTPESVKNENTEKPSRAFEQTDSYAPPDFKSFFPDNKDGALALGALWNAADKDSRPDSEILKTVREGFRNTHQDRMPILRWIGNKYIWNKSPQNPDAVEIMYHAADFIGEEADPSETRHSAVYFGLSVTQPKTPAILRTLAELSMRVNDPNDLDRVAWGCSNQKAELLEYLKPFEASNDEAVRNKADVCRRIFTGELKAFVWAAEQARQRAERTYGSQLPQFKETLMSGSSEERLKALQTILAQRIALIMDDSFVAAFAKCAEDKDPRVRVQSTIIAGGKWVWEAEEQNPDAIQLMLKLSKDDHRDVRYNAVYYGLSTVLNKSDDVIRRLLEMAFEDREPNLFHRIGWGLRDDRERVASLLTEYINGDNATQAEAAREVFTQLAGGAPPPIHRTETPSDPAHTISGFVMEFRSGTPDVPVCLCDAATGLPVAKGTYKPMDWSTAANGSWALDMAIVVSDEKGNFRFDNVPDGKYRLIAQKWMGPYKGVFELHGAEIRLMGAIDDITVPRPADEQAARVVPVPMGENTIQLNQDVANNETFLFLSTAPPEFDPILGLQGLGTAFWKNLIGVNRMPLGKTTVIGAPNKTVYAFLFAADNSPGFATITIPPPESGIVRLPAESFVAGWSNGRKTPPPKLAELMEFMKTQELTTQQLLEIPELSNANFKAYQARMQELMSDLSRVIELPEGESARVGDLMAADAYRRLQK